MFKLPCEKHGAWLQEHRAEVIQRLNAGYFKPWFLTKKDNQIVEDLGDMTYEETVLRLVRLRYVTHRDHWHKTLTTFTAPLRRSIKCWVPRTAKSDSGHASPRLHIGSTLVQDEQSHRCGSPLGSQVRFPPCFLFPL